MRIPDDRKRYGFHEYSLQEDLEQLLLSMKLYAELLENNSSVVDGQFTTQNIAYTLNMYCEQVYHAMSKAAQLESLVENEVEND